MYEFPEEIQDIVNSFWEFTLPLPMPKFVPTCPLCSEEAFILRTWRMWDRREETGSVEEHRLPFRIDVSLKCLACGWVAKCGIPVTEEQIGEALEYTGGKMGDVAVWDAAAQLGVI